MRSAAKAMSAWGGWRSSSTGRASPSPVTLPAHKARAQSLTPSHSLLCLGGESQGKETASAAPLGRRLNAAGGLRWRFAKP